MKSNPAIQATIDLTAGAAGNPRENSILSASSALYT